MQLFLTGLCALLVLSRVGGSPIPINRGMNTPPSSPPDGQNGSNSSHHQNTGGNRAGKAPHDDP
ncbi:hypothetical protein PGT21_003296 [Puccinia graminis f. sp. tritici]|uniref:Uncharacterized protein n=2 Tax=Puccinia graminis f. sp. tritici TaxID=56615 RepID=H6QS92_PUCGT|nr:uncharacterized protein PGTG_21709 [Puccinia graminis f. sp. tritici CRL 75-36-700-3]EHS63616.1 hypothetical protein PGTG_21709 [Puccinia graminis f. sp. tritici CRL 75-36-700-3]KAA1100979.1 hypothetical protein PGT21_003296 [Puccinia graminis f. sp. tritici]